MNDLSLLTQSKPGFLNFGEARMALVDIEAGFWSIRRQVEALIGRGQTNYVLQQAGVNGGFSFAKRFHEFGPDHSIEDIFRACLNAYQTAGFGEFELLAISMEDCRLKVRGNGTFEAWMTMQNGRQQNDDGICAYTAGVLVGFMNAITGRRDIVCYEHACQAAGAQYCSFELLPANCACHHPVVSVSPDPSLGRQINLLEMLFDHMPMGIAIIDLNFNLVRCNPTWAEFIDQYTPSNAFQVVPGANLFDLEPGTEDMLLPMFQRVFAGETIRQDAVQIETGGITSFWDVVLSPLYDGENIVGVLNVSTDATERKTIYLELEKRVEERTHELSRRKEIAESLADILAALNSTRSSHEVFDFIIRRSCELLHADSGLIYRVDGSMMIQESNWQFPPGLSAAKKGMFYRGEHNQSIAAGRPVPVENAAAYISNLLQLDILTDFQRSWYLQIREHFQSYLGLPVMLNGQQFGALIFYYREQHTFTQEEIQLATILTDHAKLAIENAHLRQEEVNRQDDLRLLLDMSAVANRSLDMNETISTSLELMIKQFRALSAALFIVDLDTRQLMPPVIRPDHARSTMAGKKVVEACHSILYSDNPVTLQVITNAEKRTSTVLLPLRTRKTTVGILVLESRAARRFRENEHELLQSIADQMSIAIENARLYSQAEQVAVAQERNRLARDLHDAVSQTLFSANLIADVLPKIWERKPEIGMMKLEELKTLTRGALSEMRTLLLELRPAALVETDLEDLFQHLGNAFEARSRIPLELIIAGHTDPAPDVKEVVFRIAQETLSNISKHAGANHVTIQLDREEHMIELKIEDDGIGFNPAESAGDHLGLNIMQERAQTIGALLEIQSRIGEGTHIHFKWEKSSK